jgi:ubiquinone biosynthesis protein COQ4
MADQISALLEEACGGPLIGMADLFEDSPYLQSDKLREWMGVMMLRPMSKLSPFDFAYWYFRLLRDVVDKDRINLLFAQERRRNPRLDTWMSRRDISTYSLEDL